VKGQRCVRVAPEKRQGWKSRQYVGGWWEFGFWLRLDSSLVAVIAAGWRLGDRVKNVELVVDIADKKVPGSTPLIVGREFRDAAKLFLDEAIVAMNIIELGSSQNDVMAQCSKVTGAFARIEPHNADEITASDGLRGYYHEVKNVEEEIRVNTRFLFSEYADVRILARKTHERTVGRAVAARAAMRQLRGKFE
jgi:hypothetical protein